MFVPAPREVTGRSPSSTRRFVPSTLVARRVIGKDTMQETDSAASTALFLRATEPDGLRDAVEVGADGVSYAVELRADGIAAVGGTPLAERVSEATNAGLRVEIVAGEALRPTPATPLIAAIVAALVSARQVSPGVHVSSFDHAAALAIGRSVPQLSVALRHLSTLHRGADYARGAGARMLSPMVGAATAADVDAARHSGIGTHGWTVNVPGWPLDEAAQLDAAEAAGFDAVTVGDAALVAAKRGAR